MAATAERVEARAGEEASHDPVALLAGTVSTPAAHEDAPVAAESSEVSSTGERRHPHPIDEKRQRLYRENALHAAMAGAMNVGDHQGLRALIHEYQLEYPEDEHRLQEGYGLVADCLEHWTPERREVARAYWSQHRGSLVRRFIRRHCLERTPH